MRLSFFFICILLVVIPIAAGCSDSEKTPTPTIPPDTTTPTISTPLITYTEDREPCECRNEERNLYWGEMHAHTVLSWDAQSYELRVTPAQAYDFAKGDSLLLPPLNEEGEGTRLVQLSRPLDFVALSDHLEFFSEALLCTDPESDKYDSPSCQAYREGGEDNAQMFGMKTAQVRPVHFEDICPEGTDVCREAFTQIWGSYVQAAEDAYDKSSECSFTTFVGYEYTGGPKVSNNHRNVIFRNAQVPEIPPSYFEQQTEEGLWLELKQICLDEDNGCDVIVIPHNSNWSNGNLFTPDYPEGMSLAEQAELAALRLRMEPLVEIQQHKGDMECKNGFEGISYDPMCDFEKIREADFEDCGDIPGSMGIIYAGCVSRYDFLRNILKLGLIEEQRLGINTYKIGVIGSTDTHNGTPGNVEEYDFPGHIGIVDDTPEKRLGPGTTTHNPLPSNPGGLAAVWAVENSRDALFEAFRNRETYSTSGPRITVRFFGGWNYPEDLCSDPDFVSIGYENGVPMGSDLPDRPDDNISPVFAVKALKDPGVEEYPGIDLQQIHIIKGWIDPDGTQHEKVFMVAGDPENGAGVNTDTCTPTGEGWDELCALWEDPEFDPDKPAFYYARVIENPSCSWKQYDCNTFAPGDPDIPEVCSNTTSQKVIQERAITSAIWYNPDS